MNRHRPPGRGHVYRRGSVWWISLWIHGRRRRESSHSARRSDAERLLSERVALLAPDADVGNTRLQDLAGAVLSDYEVNGRRSTLRLRACLAHLQEFFGPRCLARSIDEPALAEYSRVRVAAGAGPGTINLELAALRRAFRLAHELHKVARMPRFRLLQPPPARAGFVEPNALAGILRALPRHVRPVVLTAATTGWRLSSEVLTRGWQHLDLDAGWVRLEPGEGKSGRGRMFPLTAALRTALQDQVHRADDIERVTGRRPPTLFFAPSGRPIRSIRRAWTKACAAAGVPHLRPHDLRRTAVRTMERAGVPRSSAMQLVGHRTDAIYSRYAITDEAMLREATRKLDRQRRRRAR